MRRHRSRPPATSRFGGPPGRRPRPPHGRRHTPAPGRPGLVAVGQPRGRQRAPDGQRGRRVLGPNPSGCPSTRRTPRLAGGPAHRGGTGPGRHRKAPYTRAAAPSTASRSGCPPRRTRGLPSGVTPQSTAHRQFLYLARRHSTQGRNHDARRTAGGRLPHAPEGNGLGRRRRRRGARARHATRPLFGPLVRRNVSLRESSHAGQAICSRCPTNRPATGCSLPVESCQDAREV